MGNFAVAATYLLFRDFVRHAFEDRRVDTTCGTRFSNSPQARMSHFATLAFQDEPAGYSAQVRKRKGETNAGDARRRGRERMFDPNWRVAERGQE